VPFPTLRNPPELFFAEHEFFSSSSFFLV